MMSVKFVSIPTFSVVKNWLKHLSLFIM